MAIRHLTAIIEREDDGYVSLCPELDIASQGETVDRARENLREALELFLSVINEFDGLIFMLGDGYNGHKIKRNGVSFSPAAISVLTLYDQNGGSLVVSPGAF